MKNRAKNINTQSVYFKAITKLENSGIRATRQRKILTKLIFENGNNHFTAEELFKKVNKLNYKISLATIYNTLKSFSNYDMLREIVVDQNKSIYCTNHEPHYHLYIEDEEKVIDIPNEYFDLSRISEIPACLKLHNIDIIVRVRTLKDEIIKK